jgi:hypothetical protein
VPGPVTADLAPTWPPREIAHRLWLLLLHGLGTHPAQGGQCVHTKVHTYMERIPSSGRGIVKHVVSRRVAHRYAQYRPLVAHAFKFLPHRRGETLEGVALKYRMTTSELKALNKQLGLASGTREGAIFVLASHCRALCSGRLVAVPHAALASLGRRRASSARHRACRRHLLLGAGAVPRRGPGRWDWEHRDRRRGPNRCTQSRADAAGLCSNVGRMERVARCSAGDSGGSARLASCVHVHRDWAPPCI